MDVWLNANSQITQCAAVRGNGWPIAAKARKGVVMRRSKVNVDAAMPWMKKDFAKEFEGVESMKNHSEMVDPVIHEDVEDSEDSVAMDIKERATKFPDLHASYLILTMMTSRSINLVKS